MPGAVNNAVLHPRGILYVDVGEVRAKQFQAHLPVLHALEDHVAGIINDSHKIRIEVRYKAIRQAGAAADVAVVDLNIRANLIPAGKFFYSRETIHCQFIEVVIILGAVVSGRRHANRAGPHYLRGFHAALHIVQ